MADTKIDTSKNKEAADKIDANPEDKKIQDLGGPDPEWSTAQYADFAFDATKGVKYDTSIGSKASVKAEKGETISEETDEDEELEETLLTAEADAEENSDAKDEEEKEEKEEVDESDDEESTEDEEDEDEDVEPVEESDDEDEDILDIEEDDTLELNLDDLIDDDTDIVDLDEPSEDEIVSDDEIVEGDDEEVVDDTAELEFTPDREEDEPVEENADEDFPELEFDEEADEEPSEDEEESKEEVDEESDEDDSEEKSKEDVEEEKDEDSDDREKEDVAEGKIRISFKLKESKKLFEANTVLTEAEKKQSRALFEQAVRISAKKIAKQIHESYQKRYTKAQKQYEAKAIKQIDKYLSYVVEQWAKENKVALRNQLRNKITENFMKGMKNVFVENYIDIPASKVKVVESLAKNVKTLKTKLRESEARAIESHRQATETVKRERKALMKEHKARLIAEASNVVVAVERGAFTKRADNIRFTTTKEFKKNLVALREQYFVAKKTGERPSKLPTAEPLFEGKKKSGTAMDSYSSVLDKFGR